MRKAKLYKANEEIEEVSPENGKRFNLEELQGFVGGPIEFIHLDLDQIMIINEEAILMNLQENKNVTNLLPDFMILHLRIFGDVLVVDYDMVV